MTPTIYLAPVPEGTPLKTADPQALAATLPQMFPEIWSARGVRLGREHKGRLGSLLGTPNGAAARAIMDAIDTHEQITVWCDFQYKEEV